MDQRELAEYGDEILRALESAGGTMALNIDSKANHMMIKVDVLPGCPASITLELPENSIFEWQNRLRENLRKTWREGGNEGDPKTVLLTQR